MDDDYDDADELGDDDEDVDDEDVEKGAAAMICQSPGAAELQFTDSLAAAVQLAEQNPCPWSGCLGAHCVGYRDGARVRIVAATATADPDALRERVRAVSRAHAEREREKNRQHYWRTQRKLGLAPEEETDGVDDP